MQIDKNRYFSNKQKIALEMSSNKICSICKNPILKNDKTHFHHANPHTLGGKSDVKNGQIVHAKCNLRIGGHFSELSELKIKLRKWQEKSLSKFINKIENLKNEKWIRFSIGAEPASGKTAAILSKFYLLKKRNIVDFAIIVVPGTSIKPGWVRTSKNIFDLNVVENITNLGIARWQGEQPSDIDAICITYQQLQHNSEAYKLLLKNNRCLVILDEAHHLASELKWGITCSDVFLNEAHIISCSGTFFRTDGGKIFSLEYSDSGKAICDIEYTYREGLSENVLRPINFNFLDGTQKWLENSEEKSATFKDTLSKSDKSRVLNTALKASDNIFIDKMILLMKKKLYFKHMFQFTNAKAVIFCVDQPHARKVASRVRELTGDKVLLAISDNEVTAKQLADFNESDAIYCVSVRKLGEGFSANNINVVGYATNVRQEAAFRQNIHRGTRMVTQLGTNFQITEVVLPRDETLKKFADSFELDKQHYLKQKSEEKKKVGKSAKFSTFTPLSSDAILDTVVKIDISRLKAANQNRELVEVSPESKKKITYRDQKDIISDRCNKLVRQIARVTGEKHQKVHHRCYLDGGKRNDLCSLDEMKFKLLWFENEASKLNILR